MIIRITTTLLLHLLIGSRRRSSSSRNKAFSIPVTAKALFLTPKRSFGSSCLLHRPSSLLVLSATNRAKHYPPSKHSIDPTPTISGQNHTSSSSDTYNRMSSTGSAATAAAVVDAEPPLEEIVFPEQILEYDHYKGVTIHWNDASANLLLQQQQLQPQSPDDTTIDRFFVQTLQHQLALWKANGTRGVWLHVDPSQASIVPWAIQEGFEFHMVLHPDKTLILSQWLPTHTPSRLPHPPSHQIGVGCLVWHPEDECAVDNDDDDDRRLLVVQEKTGPAAKFGLWKMPTGLADPSEDIPDAAVRELLEETGLHATFDGMVGFRQAHSTPPTTHTTDTKKWGGVSRKASDLFFVCQLSLKKNSPQPTQTPQWTACPQEIAAIQWMKVSDYCQQERWQFSPLYQQFNQVIRHAAQYHLWEYQTLPLRNDDPHGYTNTLYHSKKISRPEQPPPTSSEEEGDTASKL